MENRPLWRRLGWPALLALVFVVILLVVFLFEALTVPRERPAQGDTAAYEASVERLLANADASRGEPLLITYQCTTCHFEGSTVAPNFAGISSRAADQHPPLSAEAYLYESIIYPTAYVTPDYAEIMPQNYGDRLSDQELGDIIAYLLTQ